MRDLKNNVATAQGLVATLSGVTPAAGNVVDLQGYDSVAVVVQTGTVTDAGTTAGFTVQLQESDTTAAADFSDVSGASLTVTADTDDDVAVGVIGYVGNSRYLRVVATGTTGTDATVSAQFVLGNAEATPAGVAEAEISAT